MFGIDVWLQENVFEEVSFGKTSVSQYLLDAGFCLLSLSIHGERMTRQASYMTTLDGLTLNEFSNLSLVPGYKSNADRVRILADHLLSSIPL